MFDQLLDLVDPTLRSRSGRVFYSGRGAFSDRCDVYILGLNPGGDPNDPGLGSIGDDIIRARTRPEVDWSAYCDEGWKGSEPGRRPLQRRVAHLLEQLGRDPRKVPASNVIFVRTAREGGLAKAEKSELLRACWKVHEAVIGGLGVRTVLCFGGTAGRWARQAVGADERIGCFSETNARGWKSLAHRNAKGLRIVTLTHPGVADWTTPSADPSEWIRSLR